MLIKTLYEEVIDLRNRLSMDGDDVIYQEDHLVLDAVLDLIEKELEDAKNNL